MTSATDVGVCRKVILYRWHITMFTRTALSSIPHIKRASVGVIKNKWTRSQTQITTVILFVENPTRDLTIPVRVLTQLWKMTELVEIHDRERSVTDF